MSNNDQYEYPEGSNPDKKYGMLSKDGRTESLIPNWARDPKMLSMALLAGTMFYLVTHLLSYALGERGKHKDKVDTAVQTTIQNSNDKITEISSRLEADKNNTKRTLNNFSNKFNDISSSASNAIRQTQANSAQIVEIKQKISSSEQKLEELTKQLTSMNQSITDINKKMTKTKKKAKVRKQPVKLINYYLKAMVHGRAWIESEAGDYLTVKVGDKLDTYGVITSFDDINGQIRTSSGRDINYANN